MMANLRGSIRVDGGRRRYMSKDASHFSSWNTVETVVGDGRVGYRSQTSLSSSHNPVDRGILLILPSFEGLDSRGDGERRGSRSQYISHS